MSQRKTFSSNHLGSVTGGLQIKLTKDQRRKHLHTYTHGSIQRMWFQEVARIYNLDTIFIGGGKGIKTL